MTIAPSEGEPLIVVAPVYNEELNIREFLARLAAVAGRIGLAGVVMVDDGSKDQTVTLIEELAGSCPVPVRLVRLSRNFGHQTAVVAGCDEAVAWGEEIGAVWIGVLDADLQDRPEDFETLLAQSAGRDVVYAVRGKRLDGFVMRTFAPLFYKMLFASSSFPIPPNAGTFSIIRLPVCKLIVAGADSEPYFPGLRAWVGFRQAGVELPRQARAQGESKVALKGLIRLSLRAFMLYSNLPMRLFWSFGLFLLVAVGLITLAVVVLRLTHVLQPSGVASIMILQLGSLGLLIVFLGLIAFMIDRTKQNASRQGSWMVMERKHLLPRETAPSGESSPAGR
jgi:dolichol-phosphate mannosyltransferase